MELERATILHCIVVDTVRVCPMPGIRVGTHRNFAPLARILRGDLIPVFAEVRWKISPDDVAEKLALNASSPTERRAR